MRNFLGGFRYAIFIIPLIFLLVFFFYPLTNIFRLTLTSEGIEEIFSKSYYLKTAWFTFWQATLSTALTIIIGLPAAYLFAKYQFRGKGLFRALATVPFVLPTIVVAAAFRSLLGPSGPVNETLMNIFALERAPIRVEQTLTIILLAHVYYNIAVVIRLVGGYWANLSPSLSDAARLLGASPLKAFLLVTLPLLRPPLLSAALLIFLFTFTSFGVILILGGPVFSTIETEIYRQYATFLRPSIAAALSLLQIFFTFILMLLYAHFQRKSAVPLDLRPQKSTLRKPQSLAEKSLVWSMVIGYGIFLLAPLIALVVQSFQDRAGDFTLAYYRALPELQRGSILYISPSEAILNSLGFALLTMLGASMLGLASAWLLSQPRRGRSVLEPMFMLPLGASAVTLGFAYVLSLGSLRTSAVLVLIAHTLVALPFVVRSVLPVLQGIRPNLRESALVLGATPIMVWREIDMPIVGRALLVAAVFAFTVSMGEFGATSFIARPNSGYLTLPIAIQRYLSQPGSLNFGQAMAMSAILMAVCTIGFIAIERFRYADIGEF
jgi:thiamine transport system permease protein